MPALATRSTTEPNYRSLFPSWEGQRPVSWFFGEQLLEARAESDLPTNGLGPDEDVNAYLLGLLRRWVAGDPRDGVDPGVDPLVRVPAADLGGRQRADYWRRQADHRLMALGLFDRGDLARRRRVGFRFTAAEMRDRDLTVLIRCYAQAADALADRPECQGLVTVWRKLAQHGPRYVHVLQTLARRRLGFGARLGEAELARLVAGA